MLRGSSSSDKLLDPSLQYLTSDNSADVLLVSISSWARMMLGTLGMLCVCVCVCVCVFIVSVFVAFCVRQIVLTKVVHHVYKKYIPNLRSYTIPLAS